MRRILLIDDEGLVRSTLAQMLRKAQFDVEEAKDGDEGIQLFERKRADIVVTDIIMPNKEGIETIAELRKIDADVKIIAISGGGRIGNHDYLTVARKLGAHEVLKKPFSPKEILDAIDRVSKLPSAPRHPA